MKCVIKVLSTDKTEALGYLGTDPNCIPIVPTIDEAKIFDTQRAVDAKVKKLNVEYTSAHFIRRFVSIKEL